MADVRGQLILLAGLLLAVTFIMLALLLNTVIFSENLASRGTDLGGGDAIEFQRTVIDDVGRLVDEENEAEHGSGPAVRGNVSSGIDNLTAIIRLRNAQFGVASAVSNVTLHDGALIRQTDPTRNLNDSSDNADWTLAEDINDTRRFAMTVTGELNSTTQPGDGFNVSLQGDGGNSWHLYVYDNASDTDAVEIAVQNGTEPVETDVCSPAGLPLTIDLTAGTVNGTPCPAISFAKGIATPYDIQFDNGQHATGTYNLTVNVSGSGSVDTTALNGPGPAASPYYVHAVYSVHLDVHYVSPDVRYRTDLRIARGEPA